MSTINVTNLSGRGGATPNLPDGANVTGVVTATSFDGSLKTTGTPTLGVGVTINASGVAISGVCTAGIGSFTTVYGDGSNLTGVGESIGVWYYNPEVNDITVPVATGIGFTFSKKVLAGSGTATLKIVNAGAAGTTIQSWGISSFTQPTVDSISFGSLVSDLIINQTYQFDIPSGFIKDSNDTDYVGTAYTFTVEPAAIQLWTWGVGNNGKTAHNSTTHYSSPVQVPGNNWQTVTGHHEIQGAGGTRSDGSMWTWGSSDYGILGQNSLSPSNVSSPVQVPGSTWSKVVGTGNRAWGVTKTDGTLWMWGYNNYGGLGQNSPDNTNVSSPVQVPGTTWPTTNRNHSIRGSGAFHSIKTDGTLWCWGENTDGDLGQNDRVYRSSPVQIPGTTWASIGGNQDSYFGVKTDGTLWVWGSNNSGGELGLNDVAKRSSPTQVPGTTWSYATSSANYNTSFAIKTDGTLWSWGANYYGLRGVNNGTESARVSSPVQIPGTTWRSIDAGFKGTAIATKTDGTMWAWGNNTAGELGVNDAVVRSSPVQIPGTDWQTQISLDKQSVYAMKEDTTP